VPGRRCEDAGKCSLVSKSIDERESGGEAAKSGKWGRGGEGREVFDASEEHRGGAESVRLPGIGSARGMPRGSAESV
jgi:hypothetical protein